MERPTLTCDKCGCTRKGTVKDAWGYIKDKTTGIKCDKCEGIMWVPQNNRKKWEKVEGKYRKKPISEKSATITWDS